MEFQDSLREKKGKLTALVIGGTGLVGNELVRLLIQNDDFEKVVVFGRGSINIDHPKLTEYLIDFASPESWRDLVCGDVLFSTLGTTLAAAGSKAKQYEIDYTYQYKFAETASKNGVNEYVLVSSIGANPSSPFFYMRMKGELEESVSNLPFEKTIILRPAQLYGARKEKRSGEEIGLKVTRFLNKIGLMRKRLPIHAKTVAKAMLNSLNNNKPFARYTGNELFEIAKNNSL